MSWERARTLEQKEARIEEVLGAGRRLLLKHGFESVSLSQIASEVSFGRSNLYKYFESKEEIYLKLLAYEITHFGRELLKGLERSPKVEESIEAFAALWISRVKKEKVMLMLLSMAGTILEKNCSDRILLESKIAMAEASQESFIPCVLKFFPGLTEDAASGLLMFLIVTATGLFPLSGLNKRQKQLLRKENLGAMVHDFEDTYERIIIAHLRSLQVNNSH